MPLGHNVSENIRQLYRENEQKPAGQKRSRAQMIAIAYSAARTKYASSPNPLVAPYTPEPGYPHYNPQHTRPVPKGRPNRKLTYRAQDLPYPENYS